MHILFFIKKIAFLSYFEKNTRISQKNLVVFNLISGIYLTYKFIIPHIKKKKNIFIFLKYKPSSHEFNKLVIKSKIHANIYF
jgi:hypothetical protein